MVSFLIEKFPYKSESRKMDKLQKYEKRGEVSNEV